MSKYFPIKYGRSSVRPFKKEDVINKFDEMRPLTKEMLKDILDEKNYVTKADLLELKRRFDIIEEKLDIIINKSNEAKTEE